MQPTQELIDDIYREKVLRARATPPEQKIFAGIELFEYACGITRAGIRHQHPDADDARVEQILAERFALKERLENSKWTSTLPFYA